VAGGAGVQHQLAVGPWQCRGTASNPVTASAGGVGTTLLVGYWGRPGRVLNLRESEWPDAHRKQQGRRHEEQQEEGEDA
jgi:hypothetical protein